MEREKHQAEMAADAARAAAETERDLLVERIKADAALALQRERLLAERELKRAELETRIALAQAEALRSVTPDEAVNPAVQATLDGITRTTDELLQPGARP